MQEDIKAHGVSHRGTNRETNEDQFLIADLCRSMVVHSTSLDVTNHSRLFGGSQGMLLLVADGMGGHAAGERASTLAVETLSDYVLNYLRWLFRLDPELEDDFIEDLKHAVRRCDLTIQDEAAELPDTKRMGTTLTMGYIVWPRLYVVHAGDSRCYLLRDAALHQVTRDHTLAQRMVEAGDMTAEAAEGSRASHVLLNALGGSEESVEPEVHRTALKPGDTLLLCTDGLTGHLSDDEIHSCFKDDGGLDDLCQRLVDRARGAGASDDVTVVVARVPATARTADEVTAATEPTTKVAVPPAARPARQPDGP